MKYTITLLVIFIFSFIPLSAENCDDAYSSATYAFQHIKKSLGWNNIQSQRQYANKAITAMEKVYTITKSCGCKDANNKSFDVLEKLKKSLEQDTFETSRYQISKANIDAKEVLAFLDSCRNDPMMYLESDEANLIVQEQELLLQQQRLFEEQKKLQIRLELQKLKQQQLAKQKVAKFNAQKELKLDAEAALKDFEVLVLNLISTLECKQDFPVPNDYVRTLEDMETESLEATRLHYTNKVREIAFSLINNLSVCGPKE